jgi:serine/arginine repetitive matrix protein 2
MLRTLLKETGLVLVLESLSTDGDTHISRSSVYETIEEEMSNASSPAQSLLSKKSSPTRRQPVFVVDSDTLSIHSKPEESTWDDECGIEKIL